MSLKDLLPEGTFEEIEQEANANAQALGMDVDKTQDTQSDVLMVSCPYCKKRIPYSKDNPFRPFCSERCKMLDLGAWANEERTVKGNEVNQDEDADLLSDPNLPVRGLPEDMR